MDTNNLVESWHKTLKKCHLGSKCNVRADYLFYLLYDIVNTEFRVKFLKIKSGFLPLGLSAYDKKRKAIATALDPFDARAMVTEHMDEENLGIL